MKRQMKRLRFRCDAPAHRFSISLAATSVLCAAVAGPAAALESKGYVRAGGGGTSEGGTQNCFLLSGAEAKYRLGNECEQYAELQLSHQAGRFDNGMAFNVVGMAHAFNRYGKALTFEGDNGSIRLRQLYGEVSGIPSLNGGSFWAGRRFYKRNDVHINDFFYWNPTGVGAGIENAKVGQALLSYAFFRRGDVGDNRAVSRHDFQVGGIDTNPGGQVNFGLSYIAKPGDQPNANNGWSLTVQHVQKPLYGGANKLTLQYGRGPGTGLGGVGDLLADNSTQRWRMVEAIDWQMTPEFGGQFTTVYQHDKRPTGNQRWISVGVRPVYAFTEHLKLAVEAGHDHVKPGNGPDRTLTKLTIAPILAMQKAFWSRPELRLFYTYARWNQAAQDAAAPGDALSRTGVFGPGRHGSTFGIQFETWW